MSWGERSCTGNKDCRPTCATCNVDCPLYEWDRKTKPDSVHADPVGFIKKVIKDGGTVIDVNGIPFQIQDIKRLDHTERNRRRRRRKTQKRKNEVRR